MSSNLLGKISHPEKQQNPGPNRRGGDDEFSADGDPKQAAESPSKRAQPRRVTQLRNAGKRSGISRSGTHLLALIVLHLAGPGSRREAPASGRTGRAAPNGRYPQTEGQARGIGRRGAAPRDPGRRARRWAVGRAGSARAGSRRRGGARNGTRGRP